MELLKGRLVSVGGRQNGMLRHSFQNINNRMVCSAYAVQ